MKKRKAKKIHNECKALTRLILATGADSRMPWETGISRVLKLVNEIRARLKQKLIQTDTLRRYANGQKGYEDGLPARTYNNLMQLGFAIYL